MEGALVWSISSVEDILANVEERRLIKEERGQMNEGIRGTKGMRGVRDNGGVIDKRRKLF